MQFPAKSVALGLFSGRSRVQEQQVHGLEGWSEGATNSGSSLTVNAAAVVVELASAT